MLISNRPGNSHPLTNSLATSSTLHSSLPTPFSMQPLTTTTTSNPSLWTTKQVEEWLIKNDLRDCVDLICYQRRMDGQSLLNSNRDDILQLRGTNKNNELWAEIEKLQKHYSSNYHLLSQQQRHQQFQQSLPMTTSPYFAPSPLHAPIQIIPTQPSRPIRPTLPSVTFPPSSSSTIPTVQSQLSSNTTIHIDENRQQLPLQSQQHRNPSSSLSTIQPQTAITLERSSSTDGRSVNNHRRSLSHSLSTSNTSINILQPSPRTVRATSSLLNPHHTPAEQIEDQPITGCCFVATIRSDRKKTLSACLLALCTLYFCSFIITIVDERLPDPKNFPPLPDLILDNVKQLPWAFSVTEKIIVIEIVTLITLIVLHRHRLIILRRLFAIAAALYFLRSLTMVFTSLPVATAVTDCRPERLTSLAARLKKASLIFVGQGMASFGVKTCGDYLYSGHTCTLVLATHFINEYSPRSYHLLHFLSWILAITGMFFILAGHQHYSIDILIAWVLSSRLFIYYHTLANNRAYFQRDKSRMRIWFPFFSYFEENVKQAIPNEYCLPDIWNDTRGKFSKWYGSLRYSSDPTD